MDFVRGVEEDQLRRAGALDDGAGARGEDAGERMLAVGDESHLRDRAVRVEWLRTRPDGTVVVLDERLAQEGAAREPAHQLEIRRVHRGKLCIGRAGDEGPEVSWFCRADALRYALEVTACSAVWYCSARP